jgi:hypothetical protein
MRWIVDTGLPGYGPDASNESFIACETWCALADEIAGKLTEASESEGEVAATYGENGQYADAWKTHEHSDKMAVLALNFDINRASSPLYAENHELWHDTIRTMIAENFPYDVNQSCRIYVWESDEFGTDIENAYAMADEDQAAGDVLKDRTRAYQIMTELREDMACGRKSIGQMAQAVAEAFRPAHPCGTPENCTCVWHLAGEIDYWTGSTDSDWSASAAAALWTETGHTL